MTVAEDVQLNKMHPIISDAAMSEDVTPPEPATAVNNTISPIEEVPAATTSSHEQEQTTSSYKPSSSDATVLIAEDPSVAEEPVTIDTSNDVIKCH